MKYLQGSSPGGRHRDLAEIESSVAPDIFAALRGERDLPAASVHATSFPVLTSVQSFLDMRRRPATWLRSSRTLYRKPPGLTDLHALIDAAESGKNGKKKKKEGKNTKTRHVLWCWSEIGSLR